MDSASDKKVGPNVLRAVNDIYVGNEFKHIHFIPREKYE